MAAVPLSSLSHVIAPVTVPIPANSNPRAPAAAPRFATRPTLTAVAADRCDGLVVTHLATDAQELAAAWLVFLTLAVVGAALF